MGSSLLFKHDSISLKALNNNKCYYKDLLIIFDKFGFIYEEFIGMSPEDKEDICMSPKDDKGILKINPPDDDWTYVELKRRLAVPTIVWLYKGIPKFFLEKNLFNSHHADSAMIFSYLIQDDKWEKMYQKYIVDEKELQLKASKKL